MGPGPGPGPGAGAARRGIEIHAPARCFSTPRALFKLNGGPRRGGIDHGEMGGAGGREGLIWVKFGGRPNPPRGDKTSKTRPQDTRIKIGGHSHVKTVWRNPWIPKTGACGEVLSLKTPF